MNEGHPASKLNEIENQAAKVDPGVVEQPSKQALASLDEWTATVMRNMKRMSTDEAYRLSIAKDLS